ncbi:MAG: MFS transporter [Alphaproteobacteria bacterium]|nr:MFS transporter [Alphaproteobacteria bacterium]
MTPGAALRVLLIGLGSLTAPLDTAVNIAFPSITGHFDLPVAQIQWVVICYVLTYGSLMLVMGRIGDLFGHVAVFRAGLLWSAAAYLLCAFSPSYEWLLFFRFLQGIGAALVISCGLALVTAQCPESMRARMLGIYTLMFAAGGVIGPSLGGILVQLTDWRAVFWFRAPLALATLILLYHLPSPPRPAEREPFDLAGAGLLVLAMSTLLLAINQARHLGSGEPRAILLAVVALASLIGFVLRSGRAERPIIDLRYFRSAIFSIGVLGNVLINLAGFSVLLFVPYYLARIGGFSTGVAGFILAAGPVGSMLGAPLAGWLSGKLDPLRIALAGAALVGIGLFAIAHWGVGTGSALLVLALIVQGVGVAFNQVAYADIVTGTMPRQDRGVAGSLSMVTRTLGVVMAASLLSPLFQNLEASAADRGATALDGFLASFGVTFTVAASLPVVVLVANLLHVGARTRPV